MKKLLLILIVLQLSVFSLQAQPLADENERFKRLNDELKEKFIRGALDEALGLAQQTIDLATRIYGAESVETATAYKNVGLILRNKKQYKEAVVNLQKALEIYRKKPDENEKVIARTLRDFALTFLADSDFDKAETFSLEALTVAEKAYGQDSKDILLFLETVRDVYIADKKYDATQQIFVRLYLTTKKYFVRDSSKLQEIKDAFICFVYGNFKYKEASKKHDEFNDAISVDEDNSQKSDEEDSIKVVNGKAKNLVQPTYPKNALARKAEGVIPVRITIDEEGYVIEAKSLCGDLELRIFSVAAARASTFYPTTLNGKPVKVTGIILYKFIL